MIRVEAIRHYIQASHRVRCTAPVGLILHGLSTPLYTYSTAVRYITLQYTDAKVRMMGLILHGLSTPLYTYSTAVRYITLQYTATYIRG